MAKKYWLFFLVISVSCMAGIVLKAYAAQAAIAVSQDNSSAGDGSEETEFC